MAAIPKTDQGFVIDSASFAPLAYVNIKVKNTSRGTSTDEKGGFTIPTLKGDSLVFSLVGYNTEEFSAIELEETVLFGWPSGKRTGCDYHYRPKGKKGGARSTWFPNPTWPMYGPYGAASIWLYFGKLERKAETHKRQAEYQRQTT